MVHDQFEVLVVEDEAPVRSLVATTLDLRGYRCIQAEDGASGLLAVASRKPDLMLLDLGLPDMDGTEVIRKVRSWSEMPIIVLSARLEDADKVEALDAGADDYLVKPFSIEELFARIRVALRRIRSDASGASGFEDAYINGDLAIDYSAAIVTISDAEIHLTPMEYKLLCLLARNTGKVLTHNYILKEVWGSALASDMASLRVFMTTLRRKIEADPSHPRYIQTHVGVGYRMMRVEEA
ncbi:MAG TPA: response regulator [Slackia equolifaciens]|uniref:Response regulator n=1 Tax=Slackia equolifaciens TaxID=498718 RepID=A0A9D3A1J7_9ACTN|nr:response regulator [Slackia equolifaciens]